MIYLDLIINLAMLVSITVISGFIDKYRGRHTMTGMLMQGVLFGAGSAVGMLRPLNLGPGLIFDGRSIMVSLCALFFGPWAAASACAITTACRIWIGGAGAVTGSLVILSSAAIGLFEHFRLRSASEPPSVLRLYLFGVAVHIAMLCLILTLPEGAGVEVAGRIGLPVLLMHPVATILAGKILSDQMAAARTMADLQQARENLETHQHYSQSLMQIRLTLLEYVADHTLDQLLTKALDETCELVNSPIGLYHFVEEDQKSLSLQQWSTRTLKEFCQAEGKGLHYGIDKAGVWVDCIHQRRAVIHNDYESLKHKKGMPEGHAKVIRELVVPIIHADKIVAILGVGNKPTDYTERDVETVSYLADVTWQIVEKKRSEEALQKSEARYRNLFENAPVGIFTTTSRGDALSVNLTMANILGFSSPQETISHYRSLQTHLYVNPERRKEFIRGLHEKGKVENFEYQAYTADGRRVWLRMNARISQQSQTTDQQERADQHGDVTSQQSGDNFFIIEGFTTDITDQKRVEEQFRQAQKMESVGRLAGGVAHDYNNMLSVIIGYTELALEEVGPSAPIYDNLQEILKAGRRSADVTRQLLAFARKQTIAPRVLDLNSTVEGMLKMIRRLIGEDIDLAWLPAGSAIWPVKMDPSQLDQILANLCVNARDAIHGVGRITIETGMVTFDKEYCNDHAGFIPGNFLLLAVSDDGCGMDKDTLDKLFEPFFTTKGVGKGTGLGLATVYGIIKQNSGFINVYSEPGKGTTFRIYLPHHKRDSVTLLKERKEKIQFGHGETLLLVEDEPSILQLGQDMLQHLGYVVLAANTTNQALKLAGDHARDISLLITDVVMPEMNGRELSERIFQIKPDIKVLFMSGYTANVIAHHGVLDEDVLFIQKPFSIKELAAKVHEALRKG